MLASLFTEKNKFVKNLGQEINKNGHFKESK